MSGRPVSISVCMMIKDEEDNLNRSLSSLKNFADELIVVDTGSTDKSIEIAKSYGAKVYEHPWEDDYSKHRNQSIGYATSDWIFIFDADEELIVNDSIEDLKKWLSSLDDTCCSCAVVLNDIQKDMKVMAFNPVRFFRRGKVEYEGIIHNAPRIIDGDSSAVICPFVSLNHYGYDLSPEKMQKKRERTERLLFKRIEENKEDIAAYFYLVQLYTAYAEYDKAVEYIHKYEEVVEKSHVEFNGSIFCTAATVFRKVGDKENSEKWLLLGLKKFPKDLDLLLHLTEYGVWQQKLNIVVNGARGFLKSFEEYQKNPIAGGNRFTYSNVPEAKAYCQFHLALGLLQESSQLFDSLKKTFITVDKRYADGMTEDVNTVLNAFGWYRKGWNYKDTSNNNAIQTVQPQKKVISLSRS